MAAPFRRHDVGSSVERAPAMSGAAPGGGFQLAVSETSSGVDGARRSDAQGVEENEQAALAHLSGERDPCHVRDVAGESDHGLDVARVGVAHADSLAITSRPTRASWSSRPL